MGLAISSGNRRANKTILNDPIDVCTEYASKKPYGLAKAGYVLGVDAPRLLGLMDPQNPLGNLVKEHLGLFKLSRSPALVVSKLKATLESARSYLTGSASVTGQKTPLYQVVRDGLGVVSPLFEVADFFTRAILFIPKASIHLLRGINGIALSILMAWNACESIAVLGRDRVADLTDPDLIAKRNEENLGALLSLVMEISYIALGVLTALPVFMAISVAPSVFTALSINTVVFTLLHFYYNNIGQERKII